MSKMNVWYQLGNRQASKVTLNATADLDDLKGAIKKVWGERIHCAAPELEVYPAGTTVPTTDTDQPFPSWKSVSETESSGEAPLIVLPQPDGESVRCSSCVFLYSKFLSENVAHLPTHTFPSTPMQSAGLGRRYLAIMTGKQRP
jgi:hypothetical protein